MKRSLFVLFVFLLVLSLAGCVWPTPTPDSPLLTSTPDSPLSTPVSPLPTVVSPLPEPVSDPVSDSISQGGILMDVAKVGELLALLAALAFLIEAVVEVAFASWLPWVIALLVPSWIEQRQEDLRALLLRVVGFAFGIALAITIGLDLIAAVVSAFNCTPNYPAGAAMIGRILTGLLLARGAQWFHDVGTTWLGLDQKALPGIVRLE